MNILLDNTEITLTPDTEKTWGDLFASLETELRKNEATIVEVQLDGKIIAVSDFDALFVLPLDTHKKVQVRTMAASDLVHLFKHSACEYVVLCVKLTNILAEFQSGKDAQVLKTITELADSLGAFLKLLPYLSLFPERFADLTVQEKPVHIFLRDFSPILDEFLKALEHKDIVLLGDIAEYEIVPRLEAVIAAGKTL